MVGHWLHKYEVPGSVPCAGITFCLQMLQNLTKIVVTGDQLFNFQLYLSVSHFKAISSIRKGQLAKFPLISILISTNPNYPFLQPLMMDHPPAFVSDVDK